MGTKKITIYFAGAIRGGREDAAIYAEIVALLRDYGEVVTEHIGGISLTAAGESISDQEIFDRDFSWLKSADVLIAEVTTPSLGVGFEIGKMTEWKRPVLCLFRPGKGISLSAMIAGARDLTVVHYETPAELKQVFDTFFRSIPAAMATAHN